MAKYDAESDIPFCSPDVIQVGDWASGAFFLPLAEVPLRRGRSASWSPLATGNRPAMTLTGSLGPLLTSESSFQKVGFLFLNPVKSTQLDTLHSRLLSGQGST